MSDLIKTSLSLENCSFHSRGERSWAGSGLKNDLALKARVLPTLFDATPRARRPLGPSRLTVAAGEAEGWVLGIHHFHPLRSRHFITRDHSVKQYDAAHFYLSRFTKSLFSRPRSFNKSLGAAPRPLAAPVPPRGGEKREGVGRGSLVSATSNPRGRKPPTLPPGQSAKVPGPCV